jgi:hypothetical protein
MAGGTDRRFEETLSRLIGLPMWGSARAVDMEMFAFGERRTVADRRGPKQVGEYALHIQCAWHIARGGRVIVGSNDLRRPADPRSDPDDFDPDVPGSTRRDRLLLELFADVEPRVRSVELRGCGELDIEFEEGLRLALFPERSGEHEECWRLFGTATDDPHYVFTTTGPEM